MLRSVRLSSPKSSEIAHAIDENLRVFDAVVLS